MSTTATAAPAPTLGILLRSGGHDAAHYALVAATAAAAIGRDVVLFATNQGCQLLLRTSPLLDDPREALRAARGGEFTAGAAAVTAATPRLQRGCGLP